MSERPSWIRVKAPSREEAAGMASVRDTLRRHRLHTVCQGAVCPNAVECWGARTATFMILGDTCTRACRFCGVPTGDPGGVVDRDEPGRIAAAVVDLGLRYVVLTSVDRDDLADGGAGPFADTVDRIKEADPDILVEVLIPDFAGNSAALDRILATAADVIGHNLETVRRLTPGVRDRRAGYERSLGVLAHLRKRDSSRVLKSGLMLGLGEDRSEVVDALGDLREAGVDIVTIGQYLKPTASPSTVPVVRFASPEEFDEIAAEGRRIGFDAVVAGPLVRSSYHAAEAYRAARSSRRKDATDRSCCG